MRKSKFSESQIVDILKDAERGIAVPDLLRKHGVSRGTFFKWRSKYVGDVAVKCRGTYPPRPPYASLGLQWKRGQWLLCAKKATSMLTILLVSLLLQGLPAGQAVIRTSTPLTAAAAVAQSLPPGPRFEVASVRVTPSADGLPEGFTLNPRRTGGRLSWTTNLYSLVSYAYHLPSWRIAGITTEQLFYRIDASMEATAGQEEVRSMLRQLLIDRFKLTTHTRVEQRSGYALVIVNAPKLQRAAATGEVAPMPDYLKGKPPAGFEGQIFASAEGKGIAAITGRGVPLARLAETLSEELQEFVIDRTGMTGNYYFGFTFRRLDYAHVDAPEVAAVFDALREELGLRLERRKGPVELLVVDHVERIPSEN